MQTEPTRSQLLEWIRRDRAEWDTILGMVDPRWMEEPGVGGNWTVKDVVAHINWSEREMVNLLETRSLTTGSPHWYKPQDDRNQAVYDENKDRPLNEVLAEEQSVYQRLVQLIEGLDEADLHDPSRLGMPPDWKPWQILGGSTFKHYQEHASDIRAWLQRNEH